MAFLTATQVFNLREKCGKFVSMILFAFIFLSSFAYGENIGLAIVATGKYIDLVDPLIESASKHFCTNHHVTYYVFTDSEYTSNYNVVCVPQKKFGWPKDSLMRFKMYSNSSDVFDGQDYVFAIDANMLFVDEVGDEILGELTAVVHPGMPYSRGSYETNSKSTAYIPQDEGKYYYIKNFFGGKKDRFLEMCHSVAKNIDIDSKNNIKAAWNDESHWNRYCATNEPDVVLSPSYCYPENWNISYSPRIVALTIDKEELRK